MEYYSGTAFFNALERLRAAEEKHATARKALVAAQGILEDATDDLSYARRHVASTFGALAGLVEMEEEVKA